MSQQEQSGICKAWARQTLEKLHPDWEISDTAVGIENGHYDFLMKGRKVQIKSSRMKWDSSDKVWIARFRRVHFSLGKEKRAQFDDLYLVIASPSGLLLIKHDLHTGICLNGKITQKEGHNVEICGSLSDAKWEEALYTIEQKLCQAGKCERIATRSFGDVDIQQFLATNSECGHARQTVYDGVPLQTMSPARRGLQIQKIAFAIDQKLHRGGNFSLPEEPTRAESGSRKSSNASADWIRDGVLVKVKSSQLGFDKRNKAWRCQFVGLKPHLFDDLWLAICCPWALCFYSCSSSKKVGTKSITFQSKDEDIREAFDEIEEKLLSKGFTKRAMVEWEWPTPEFVALRTGGANVSAHWTTRIHWFSLSIFAYGFIPTVESCWSTLVPVACLTITLMPRKTASCRLGHSSPPGEWELCRWRLDMFEKAWNHQLLPGFAFLVIF